MQRIQQKQRQKVQKNLQKKRQMQTQMTKQFLADDSIRIIIDYCRKVLSDPVSEDLTQYSPVALSKFIFEQQLKKVKVYFQQLPDQQCIIDHFLLIMIKVMDFAFEKWPFFLVGFKQMFYQIAQKKSKVIHYQQFFKYIIGQVLDFKDEEQNTEFQVKFEELKKQDYLLHDNGIKKFYHSHDLRSFFTLDQSSYMIKIYNKNMKLTTKFIPNKQKHSKRLPHALWFDYSEMAQRLAVTYSDNTLAIINLTQYMTKSRGEFDSNPNNQLVIHFQQKLVKVFYIQMLNRWALFTDQNRMYVFDQQKYRQNDPNYLIQVKIEDPDLTLFSLVELVNLSMICVIAANQIYFYNQNFTEKKHSKFSHSSNITNFYYCEQTSNYYICGAQKDITIFNIPRGHNDTFKIHSLGIHSKSNIKSFQIFPLMNTVVIADQSHEIKLYDLTKGICYQVADYSQIVKNEQNFIKTLKISKNQFALYETYTLLFEQQKIAIERDMQFSFLPETYYDQSKQQYYFSVNHQIISFSLIQGQIRKSFNQATSNISKIEGFKLGRNTHIFIVDHEKYIYEAYLKDNQPDGENKHYKKKIQIADVLQIFYDQETQYVVIVGSKTIALIKNDHFNNFSVNSILNIERMPSMILSKYNQRQKQILVMLQNQHWLIIDPKKLKIRQRFMYRFPTDLRDHQEQVIIKIQQDSEYDIDILLTNKNRIYLICIADRQKQIRISLQDYLPRKLRDLKFNFMKYFAETDHYKKNTIILCDTTGYILQADLTKLLSSEFPKFARDLVPFNNPVKDTHNILPQMIPECILIQLTKQNVKIQKKYVNLIKGHEKQIKLVDMIYLQGIKKLTVSVEGLIKLWQKQKCLFELKLPDLKKIHWDMKDIQKIKNSKSIEQVLAVIDFIKESTRQKRSPQKLLNYNKDPSINLQKQIKKLNLDEPIPIQIESKDIEQIVQKTQQINWYSARTDSKKRKYRQQEQSPNKTNFHPWRTKNSFIKIMDKASPDNKYKRKMPFDLVYLRSSLDMKDRKELNKKQEQKKQLFILPQLNNYPTQKKVIQQKQEKNQSGIDAGDENQETFQSCLYIKKNRNHKKINQFDEIDKEFKKKWMLLTAKKWIPTKQTRSKATSQFKSNRFSKNDINLSPISRQIKKDPIHQVKQLFESHNKEAAVTKRGRFIRIPQFTLKREDLFPE